MGFGSRTPSWLVVAVLAACAERQALPPGNELEDPEPTPVAALIHESVNPPDHEALALSFAPDPPSPTGPAAVERFERALADAQKRMSGDDALDACAAVESLRPSAAAAGPDVERRVCALEVRVRSRVHDISGAIDAAERWLLKCGAEGADGCRSEALGAMRAAATRHEAPAVRARVATLRKHDACLVRAERDAEGKLPKCLPDAVAFYQAEGDALMVQRALLARLRNAGRNATARMFLDADLACTEPRCLGPARRNLREAVAARLRRGDGRGAVLAALEEARVAFAVLGPEEVVRARTGLLERTCAALDAREGAGHCRALEREASAKIALKDFSRQTVHGEGLPVDALKEVHEAFGELIEECLKAEADRLEPPQSEHYGLLWVVRNDGRVDQFHLDRKDRDEGPLAQCLRAQFALWRYPRYRGELQHVEQSFVVSARERR